MKKGFTLIEMIATVIILGIVSTLAVSTILKQVNNTKAELSDAVTDIIYSSANLYSTNLELNKLEGNKYCVTLQKLIDLEYLDKNLINTVDNKIDTDNYVEIEVVDSNYKYKVVTECTETIKEIDKDAPIIASNSQNYVVVTPGTSINVIDYFDITPSSEQSPITDTACVADGNVITETSSLSIGEYNIQCTAFSKNNKSSSASITLSVSNCYDFDNSKGSITNYYCYIGNTDSYQEKSDVILPYSINKRKVETIGKSSFYSKKLTSVNFDNISSITRIESTYPNGTFENNSLTSVDLSKLTNLTKIEKHIFSNNNITEFKLPISTTIIENGAFNRNKITNLDLRYLTNLEAIGNSYNSCGKGWHFGDGSSGAFANNGMVSLKIDGLSKLKSINYLSFEFNNIDELNLSGLTNLESIGCSAFLKNNIQSLDFSGTPNLYIIYGSAFERNEINTINFNNLSKLSGIGEGAFSDNNIVNLDLSNLSDLQIINHYAFENNDISNLNLSGLTKLIGISGFNNNKLTSLDFSDLSSLIAIGIHAFSKNLLEHIPDLSNITSVEPGAFTSNMVTDENEAYVYGRNEDGSVDYTILNSYANGLAESTTIPTNIVEIQDYAFERCNLKSLDLSGLTNLKKLGYNAFYGNSLTTVNLSGLSSLEVIGDQVFMSNPIRTVDLSGLTSIKKIGSRMFYLDSTLKSVNFGNLPKVTSIGYGAFANCSLSSLDLSGLTNLEKIDPYAFQDNDLTSLDLSSLTKLKSIEYDAFYKNNLTSVDLSGLTNLNKIDYRAFSKNNLSNPNLTTIYTNGNIFDWGRIINGSSGYNFATGIVTNSLGDVTITIK